jgi:hypothetical protein
MTPKSDSAVNLVSDDVAHAPCVPCRDSLDTFGELIAL